MIQAKVELGRPKFYFEYVEYLEQVITTFALLFEYFHVLFIKVEQYLADSGIPYTIISFILRKVMPGMVEHYLLEHQYFVHIIILLSLTSL
ncbi:hypothetical protein CMV_016028 [Castanea mollissima]|uniref:Uncharacterized protein n=1 Tax=Castanea mollissima TaxID=60419 RepID=A0A8J4R887_9ROSI|nr:hypothetical protein CMV_016028 [Castanea mollissima]